MRNLLVFFALIMLSGFFSNCINSNQTNNKPIAKVHGSYLYISDIEDIFPPNVTPNDSLQILQAYVDRWVRKQLLLNKAEKNLTEKQKNVSQQLEDYRSSLLIFKYEQEFIHQKLDTVISFEEINTFYEDNLSNFILDQSIVKALFVKVPIEDPLSERIRSLYKSNQEDDIRTIDNLAYQVAVKYDYFNDQWIPFSQIQKELPQTIDNPDVFLLRNRSFEMKDSIFSYFVNLRDVILQGQQAPLVFEKENIRNILLNKRKQRLITDLETRIYNDARNHNHFTLFFD